MVFNCEFCMVSVPSEEAMEAHLKGKRHQRIMEITKRREQGANQTVFTRGFRDDTTEEELQEYFTKFGEVANIFMEYKRSGMFALVEFKEESHAQAAISHSNHELKGNRFTVKPRKVKKVPKKALKAKYLRTKENAKWRAMREGKMAIAMDQAELAHKIASAESVEEQMRALTDYMRMSDEEITQKQEICDMLQNALVKFFPACTIHQFGSSVNGFGVKGCDADIYLDFHDDEGEEESMEIPTTDQAPVKLPYHRDIKSMPQKNEGPLTLSELREMQPYDKVKLVSRILVEHSLGCTGIVVIPSTRCPLIKFTHDPTGIKCDLSINNKLALRNTRLLQMCSRIDDRVGLMMYTVRFWAKVKEIAGNLTSGPRLTNYALTLLVIQYLQSLEVPLLPTISKLAEMAGKKKVIIDGWDCSYLEEAEAFGPTANTQSAEVLLKGFFEYFASLDFSTVVFQTRTGRVMPIEEMIEELTDAGTLHKSQSFKISAICIQDPFVLDHNVAYNVNEKMKQKISEEFQIASKKCETWTDLVEGMPGPGGEMFGLGAILAQAIPPQLYHKIIRLSQFDEDMEEGNVFTLLLKVSQLPLEAFKNLQTPDFRLDWCFKVCYFIQRVMETILMFETQVLAQTIADDTEDLIGEDMDVDPQLLQSEESPRKRRANQTSTAGSKKSREEPFVVPRSGVGSQPYAQKVGGVGPSPGLGRSAGLHMELLCSSCCRTWNARKTIRKEVSVDEELTGLELEREISEQIIENTGFSEKYLLQFRIDIDTVTEMSKTAVMIRLEPITGVKEFACFFSFFKTFIRRLVEKNLYETW